VVIFEARRFRNRQRERQKESEGRGTKGHKELHPEAKKNF